MSRVAEACPGLGAAAAHSAVAAAAPSAKALSVLAKALGPGPAALLVGAPPVVGKLVRELQALGADLPEPTCARCGRGHPELALTDGAGLCPRCRARHNATACSRCGVVKVVYGRGPAGEALCSVCAPRPERRCSRCGRVGRIARRAHDGQGEVCNSCFHGPVATCSACGRERPCNFVAAGRPICPTCSPRRPSRCAHCGEDRPACARWPEGPVCEPCLPGRSIAPRHLQGLRGRTAPRFAAGPGGQARLCAGCSGAPQLATCRSCGAEERPYLDGRCVRCALAARAAELVGAPDGPLGAVYRAIVAAPQPYSAHNWLRRSVAAKLLGEVASGQVALAHEALDAHPARRGADYLRHLLVANGVLPARDDGLVRLEAWVGGRLASIEDKPRRQLLRSYATWHLLRGARQRAGTARAPRAPTRYAKVNLNSAIAFLGFLAARQRDLAGATQADVDAWLADGPPNAPEVRDFLGWAARRKLVPAFVLPVSTRHEGPVADDDERWATARLLLQGDDVELTDRVAGLLVLLYGQRLSRIVALTRDQVELAPGAVRLHLGTTPLEVPPPLDELVARLVKERRPYAGAGSPAATPWLFSGLDPGLPLTAGQLGRRLRRLGVRPAANRRSALAHLASRLPAAMLAQALGYSPGTAVRWAGQVGADWGNYAASFARSAPTGR
ncbi:MAG: hypothetical protein ACYCXN_16115 [Acidimicrobiales bacterium]